MPAGIPGTTGQRLPRGPAAPRLSTIVGKRGDDPKKVEALKKWVQTPRSSWVWGIRYQANSTALDVQYKDKKRRVTALCRYPQVHINTYYGMRKVASKGKFVHRNLYTRPYVLLKGQRSKRRRRKARR